MDGQTAGLAAGSPVPALFWHTLLLPSLWRRTGEGGVLPCHGGGCGAQQQKNVDDAAFRHPAHVRLRCLAPALHVIQQLPEKRLQVGRGVKESRRTPPNSSPGPPSRPFPHLASGVGADIHPGLGGVEPEDAEGATGAVCQQEWDRTVECHGVVELVLEDVQVVEAVRVPPPAGGQAGQRPPPQYHRYHPPPRLALPATHSVVRSRRLSACSGMP